MQRCLFLFAFLFYFLPPGLAQIDKSLKSKIVVKKQQGQFDKAEKLLKDELKSQSARIPIWMELGILYTEKKEWNNARSWFDKIIKKDADNLLAAYYLGICNREIGKFQATLFRYLSFEQSENYFNQVVAADSFFLDVFYQYSLLDHLRKKYTKAIIKGQIQLRLKPELENATIGLFFLYRSFTLHANSSTVEKWLMEDSSIYSQLFLAELYRNQQAYPLADSIYQHLVNGNKPVVNIPAQLYLVRSKISQQKPLEGEMIYWKTVQSIRDTLDARFLFEDAKYIITDQEINNYYSLQDIKSFKTFFKTFWLKRDPLPASPDNLRLIEHYRRLIYAEENFRFDGYRTWNANPDQQEFLDFPKAFYLNRDLNDKGLVYIRHGNPDDKSTALGARVRYNESWLYNERDGLPKLIFHFEIDEDGLAGDWRLTPMLQDEAAINAVVMWDEAYARYLRGDEGMRRRIANEIAIENRVRVDVAMRTDRHTWDNPVKNIPVYFSMANFRGPKNLTISYLYLGFPTDNILNDNSATSTINQAVVLFDKNWNQISKSDQYIKLDQDSLIYRNQIIRTFQFDLIPMFYRYAMHVDHLESQLLGAVKFNANLPYYGTDRLLCSDILLAYDISAKNPAIPITLDNMNVRPNPACQFSKNDKMYIYFEIYNLEKKATNQTKFLIKYQVDELDEKKGRGFLGLFGRKKKGQISIESERIGTLETSHEFTILDISSLNTGKKKLLINVTDKNSKKSASTEIRFKVLEE